MCGIVGIVHADGRPIDAAILERMTASLAHRGPDDHGVYIDGGNGRLPAAGLGHRRLSIIDLSIQGRQPMANEDKTVWVTYNGEIYNYPDIKRALEEKGHTFRSRCDTEIIVHGWEEYGTALFGMLNGMFALGLWDRRTGALVLARDRYGEKPLYFWREPGLFAFASELKAFCRHPRFGRALDMHTLARYLTYEYQPLSHTIYAGVSELLPAYFLVFRDGNISTQRYWDISFTPPDAAASMSEDELAEETARLLRRSVKRRLMSDVPVGVFLSGGVDSSAVVSLMAECIPPSRIKTFSIGFREKSFDESSYARIMARHAGTDHHEKILSPGMALDILPKIWDMLDEPFADASIIPTYLLSAFTRETVTVALGGDGGDELMAGYDPFLAQICARFYEKIPPFIHHRIIEPLASLLPVSHRNMSIEFRLKQFLKGMGFAFPARNQIWLGAFTPAEQREVLSEEALRVLGEYNPLTEIDEYMNGTAYRDDIDQLVYFYSRFYLAEDILTKIDRASMAVSLEVRAPFLDVDFVRFINGLPSKFKIRGFTRKYLLKKAFAHRLPAAILQRPKKGFGVPLSQWFRRELKPVLIDTFKPERIRAEGIFNPVSVEKLLAEHFCGRRDHRKKIWTLLMFEMWKQRYG